MEVLKCEREIGRKPSAAGGDLGEVCVRIRLAGVIEEEPKRCRESTLTDDRNM